MMEWEGEGDYNAEEQQFYIMKDSMAEEAETDANSPLKKWLLSAHRPTPSPPRYLLPHSSHPHNSKLSLTDQHIYSRGIVKEVMRAHQHETVRHDIHRIHHETPLYATPKPSIASQLKFSSIPPSNKLYSSVCSAKIRQISNEMEEKQRIRRTASHQDRTAESPSAHAASVNQPQSPTQPNISVSGLVTYKFSSVTAQRSLGFSQIDRLQNMKSELSSIRSKRECSRMRQKAIISRGRNHKRQLLTEQAILSGSTTSTEKYLSALMRSQEDNALIYNERANKLRFIKELMQEDNLSYEQAHHIVQQIENIHTALAEERKAEECAVVDEEREIERRRVSKRKAKVVVRYQTFVD